MALQTVNRNLLLHLLTENELTRFEIGKRLGCSAERVRQLEQKLLGRTGRQAQLERRERDERRLRANFERNGFVKAAKRRGLSVDPAKNRPLDWCKWKFYVNGKLCLLRRAYKNVGFKRRYVAMRRPWQSAAICIVELGRGKFLIVPMREMPKSRTMFLDSSKKAYASKHDWGKYLNNWSAFTP
jgi:hypothetical protein